MSYKRRNRDYRGYENKRETKERKVNTRGKRPSHVTVIPRRNEDPQRAIKRFLKKCKNEKIVENFRERTYYIKPSERRRKKKMRKLRTIQKENKSKTNDHC